MRYWFVAKKVIYHLMMQILLYEFHLVYKFSYELTRTLGHRPMNINLTPG